MLDDASLARDFPSLESMTYLNTAAEGIPPLAVGQALERYFADKQRGMDGREPHFAQWERTKELVAPLLGLSSAEVGICSCSSEAFNLAALALRLREGDEVIINELDFPAGATPWLQADSPAAVRLWRAREGALRTEDLAELLSPRTRLVSTSLVSFYNGFRVLLPELVETVRRHSDALLAVDVTQALGRVPLELEGADLVISSTHKWILGTHGGGLVGVPQARAREWTVPAGGWFNLQDAFGPNRFERAESHAGAASFTVGMPNFPAVYGIGAALEYIQEIGVENIEQATRPLVEACAAGLAELPVEMLTPKQAETTAGILAFRHPDADKIHAHLHSRDIHVMHQAGRMRIALHGYNRMREVDSLLEELHAALK